MARSTIPRLSSNDIPRAFHGLTCFILWKFVQKRDKDGGLIDDWDKVPCDKWGRTVDAQDKRNWLPMDAALRHQADGIGVGVLVNEPYACIDIDKCWNGQEWSPLAQFMMQAFPTACREVSVSGAGLHLWIEYSGDLPPLRKRITCELGSFELYTRARFIALTGYGLTGEVSDCTPALHELIKRFDMVEPLPEVVAVGDDLVRSDATGPQYSDDELIEILKRMTPPAVAFGARPSAWELWQGLPSAVSHYPSHSEADSALMCHLGFLTGCHGSRMAHLFRLSSLYRPEKYDGTGAYRLERIVRHSVTQTQKVYNVPKPGTFALAAPAPQLAWQPPQAVWEPPAGAYPGDPAAGARASALASWQPTAAAPVVLPDAIEARQLMGLPLAQREWTLLTWLPHRQVTLFGGEGGIGKTTLMIQLGMACAAGRPFLGMLPMRHRVLFVSGEDEIEDLQYRITMTAQAMGHDGSDFHVLTLEQFESPELAVADKEGRVSATPLFWHIVRMVKELKITLVMLDPAADLFGGDEIKRRQVRSFIALLRQRIAIDCNATVLLSAHPSVDAMKNSRGYSGSTAWQNSTRSVWNMTYGDKDVRTLELVKSNRAKKGETMDVIWQDHIFVRADGAQVQAESNDTADVVFMSILAKYEKRGVQLSFRPSSTYAPTVFAEDDEAAGFKKKAFTDAMMRLADAGKIEFITEGSPSKPRHHVRIKLPTPTSNALPTL